MHSLILCLLLLFALVLQLLFGLFLLLFKLFARRFVGRTVPLIELDSWLIFGHCGQWNLREVIVFRPDRFRFCTIKGAFLCGLRNVIFCERIV